MRMNAWGFLGPLEDTKVRQLAKAAAEGQTHAIEFGHENNCAIYLNAAQLRHLQSQIAAALEE
jgi:hypothetical protein